MNNKIFLHKTDKKATTYVYVGPLTFLSHCLSICLLGSKKTPNMLSILPPQSSTFKLGTIHTLPPLLLGCFQSTFFWVIWHWYLQWKLKRDVLRHQPMFLKNILLWKYLYLLLPITNLPIPTAFLTSQMFCLPLQSWTFLLLQICRLCDTKVTRMFDFGGRHHAFFWYH